MFHLHPVCIHFVLHVVVRFFFPVHIYMVLNVAVFPWCYCLARTSGLYLDCVECWCDLYFPNSLTYVCSIYNCLKVNKINYHSSWLGLWKQTINSDDYIKYLSTKVRILSSTCKLHSTTGQLMAECYQVLFMCNINLCNNFFSSRPSEPLS